MVPDDTDESNVTNAPLAVIFTSEFGPGIPLSQLPAVDHSPSSA